MIKYKKGDILGCTEDVLMHGVNMQGVMGAGVAAKLRTKWPQVYRTYIKNYNKEELQLGNVFYVPTDAVKPKYVVNAVTQERYGRYGVFVDYNAIRKCFTQVISFCVDNNLTLCCPKIGAGLAGGDWGLIKDIINTVSGDFEVIVYEL